ncbi:MAG TPA: hypothetical protein VD710_04240 [Nitrososphaeraceae archaeon]|nr:hypothetical protein [Nitrososphaeraceae archaeon]
MTMIKRPTGKLCGSIPKRGGYDGRKKGISELLNIDTTSGGTSLEFQMGPI